jgi:hypothetical protein
MGVPERASERMRENRETDKEEEVQETGRNGQTNAKVRRRRRGEDGDKNYNGQRAKVVSSFAQTSERKDEKSMLTFTEKSHVYPE